MWTKPPNRRVERRLRRGLDGRIQKIREILKVKEIDALFGESHVLHEHACYTHFTWNTRSTWEC